MSGRKIIEGLKEVIAYTKGDKSAARLVVHRSESTSSRLASIAARGIKSPSSLTAAEIRAVCASCLTQVEAETAGPKPVKAWGFLSGDGKLHRFVEYERKFAEMDREGDERIVRVEIRIPPKPVIQPKPARRGKRESVSGKHIVATRRGGKQKVK